MTESVHVRAPGKINLALRVGAPDSTGYHPLTTVFQAVDLYEDVTATRTGASDGELTLSVVGRGAAAVPTDATNLAVRAAELLRETTGATAGAHLEIVKRVPVGGGMGGGSADAAAALLACDQLWGLGLDRAELVALGGQLGADVPFALTGLTAVGTGRGDVVTSAMSSGTYHWVLATQARGTPTPTVFAEFDELGGRTAAPPELDDDLLAALRAGDPLQLARHLANDLEEAALELRPELADVLAATDRAGALAAVVSGSGPTVAALCIDASHAQSVASVLRAAQVADDVLTVTAPTHGARVLEHVQRED
ncbi:4-(cytidine 5'-diphospho)-2-C-methyl-D-erythritol kinase [Georgenia sp. MJ173]|uniref:4-(cytidine 5'-diphospho)-2-C-methyl-D-erythritol kinase n=1 Tax=Georgenia sunbinii TaxID=3117728 RepID=UPI002F262E16